MAFTDPPRTWVTNETVTAALLNTHLRDQLAAIVPSGEDATYGTFTPALNATSTDPTLGSGATTNGQYIRFGDLVHVQITIVFGTGANNGAGTYSIGSLPVSIDSTNSTSVAVGSGYITDSSGSDRGTVVAYRNAATGIRLVYATATDTATGIVTATAPWTWNDSDVMQLSLMYAAA